jgi:VPDSG-CTERM motif
MKNLLTALAAIVLLTCATCVYAVPTLTIFDGTTTITVQDNGMGDGDARPGVVSWSGTIGVWNLNIDTGITKPQIGSATQPQMDLNFTAQSTAAGTLTLTFTDSGFNASGVGVDTIGGTQPNGSVTDNIQLNGVNVMSIGPLTGGAFSGSTSGPITLGVIDVLGLQVVINHTASGITTGNKNFTVPDGGSAVALLGIALTGLEGVRRLIRRRKI